MKEKTSHNKFRIGIKTNHLKVTRNLRENSDKQTIILYRIVLAANINWSKLSFLFILSVLKRIQIYPKLQTWLKLSTVAGEHVQVI